MKQRWSKWFSKNQPPPAKTKNAMKNKPISEGMIKEEEEESKNIVKVEIKEQQNAQIDTEKEEGKMPSHKVSVMGISFNYLKTLPVGPDDTFDKACAYIKTLTKNTVGDRSFLAHLLNNAETKRYVSEKADYFVSYAWKGSWGATMSALQDHFDKQKELKEVFIWMDFAILDQHLAAETNIDFEQWSKTFGGSLLEIGKAVLVLTPAEQPIATSRAWCCFEWYSIVRSTIPFNYCINPSDKEEFIRKIIKGDIGFDFFNSIFSGINVEKATAFKPFDQESILSMLRSFGVVAVNDVCLKSIKNWFAEVVTEAEHRTAEGSEENAKVLTARATLHQTAVSSPERGQISTIILLTS